MKIKLHFNNGEILEQDILIDQSIGQEAPQIIVVEAHNRKPIGFYCIKAGKNAHEYAECITRNFDISALKK